MKKLKNLNDDERLELLQKTAKELQDVCQFSDPPIKVEGKNEEQIIEDLKEASGELLEDDEFSDQTVNVLKELKLWPFENWQDKAEEDVDDEDEGDENQVDDEVENEQEKEKETPPKKTNETEYNKISEEINEAERIRDLKTICKKYDDLKEIRGKLSSFKGPNAFADLKETMLVALGKKVNDQKVDPDEIVDDPDYEPAEEAKEEKTNKERAQEERSRKAKDKRAEKNEKPKNESKAPVKKVSNEDKINFFKPLIKSGKYTKKELVEKASQEFPEVKSATLDTFLSDSKNPKYNKFDKLVVQDDNKKLKFKS